jgi:hypothetical protein
MNNRKDVSAVMKKLKLRKVAKVAYRINGNILLLTCCDKCVVIALRMCSTSDWGNHQEEKSLG